MTLENLKLAENAVRAFFLGAGLLLSAWGAQAAPLAQLGALTEAGLPQSYDGVPLDATGVGIYASAEGHFITPFHVAGHCARLLVQREDGFFPAEILKADTNRDLAVLLTESQGTFAEFERAGAQGGPTAPKQIVRFAQLSGLGSRETLTAEFVSQIQAGAYTFVVSASSPVVGGNSGSPVILADGTVGGLVAGVGPNEPTLVFAIPAASLIGIMRDLDAPVAWRPWPEPDKPAAAAADKFTYPVLCYFDRAAEEAAKAAAHAAEQAEGQSAE